MIAMNRPEPVEISASEMPPVTCAVEPGPVITRKAWIMPIMVPNRPNSGAMVTAVSSTQSPREIFGLAAMTSSSRCSSISSASFAARSDGGGDQMALQRVRLGIGQGLQGGEFWYGT